MVIQNTITNLLSDPLPWQCLTRYACDGVTFIDIDYRELMIKKRDVVQSTPELRSVLNNVHCSEGDVLLRSNEYLQVGCDLRDLPDLQRILSDAVDIDKSRVLFVAEVSITYINVEAADALIRWTSTFPEGLHSM